LLANPRKFSAWVAVMPGQNSVPYKKTELLFMPSRRAHSRVDPTNTVDRR